MKLVELLARELDEWPKDARCASQDKDKEIRFDTCWNDFYVETLADDAGVSFGDGAIVTREMWEEERAKVKGKTEWDGEGLPPIGAKCEARAVTNISEFKWIEVKVEFISEKGVFLTSNELTGGCIGLPVKHVEFRPIRTQEQIAAQDREEAAQQMLSVAEEVGAGMYTICCALYDAGYRKQEQSE